MKIISAQQIRDADTYTIKKQSITSTDLMERAAIVCVKSILTQSETLTEFSIFCGKGNNGGDGLAIARLLASVNRKVEVYIVNHTEKESTDFSINLKRLKEQKLVSVQFVNRVDDLKPITNHNHIIIDALLGTGINKDVEDLLADVIVFINQLHLFVIALDVPSGLFCDKRPTHKNIIHANITLTFQRPKFTFLFADFYEYVGNFEILDIGLDEPFIEAQESKYHYTTAYDVNNLLIPRAKFAHKGTFGHALLLAGSKGKIGAAILSTKACLRAGAGLVSTSLPSCGYIPMQTALPEAMVLTDVNDDYLTACPDLGIYTAIGMGPGIGKEKGTVQTLKVLIQQTNVPLVLDADALNILSENKTWLSFLPANTILTPHPKEFDRLTFTHTNAFERLQTCREFALKHNVIVVLKGAHTAIVLPNQQVFFNSSGNVALAKGGSGDVLTGIILALLANGYTEEEAAIIAVYQHGLAADKYIRNNKPESMLASDLIRMLKQY